MSAPAPDPGAKPEEKKGLGKYVSRVRNIFRGGESNKRLSLFSTRGQTDPSAAPATSSTPAAPATAGQPRASAEARKLAERFNINIEPEDWKIIPAAERVEKPIRMRIHRTCHHCSTPFGPNKVCVSCNHARCTKCPRYPPKKTQKGKLPEGEAARPPQDVNRAGNYTITGEGMETGKSKYKITMPSKTGGQDLVWKKPMQRVRRTCHRCQTLFQSSVKICASCGHIRCADCARDPPKKHKYPYGYPGDAESEPPRYSCHNCETIFANDESTCSSCGHEKCPECPKAVVGKKNPETHPDVIRRVEEKLAAMRMPSSGPASLPRDAPPTTTEAELPPTEPPTDPPPPAEQPKASDTG